MPYIDRRIPHIYICGTQSTPLTALMMPAVKRERSATPSPIHSKPITHFAPATAFSSSTTLFNALSDSKPDITPPGKTSAKVVGASGTKSKERKGEGEKGKRVSHSLDDAYGCPSRIELTADRSAQHGQLKKTLHCSTCSSPSVTSASGRWSRMTAGWSTAGHTASRCTSARS